MDYPSNLVKRGMCLCFWKLYLLCVALRCPGCEANSLCNVELKTPSVLQAPAWFLAWFKEVLYFLLVWGRNPINSDQTMCTRQQHCACFALNTWELKKSGENLELIRVNSSAMLLIWTRTSVTCLQGQRWIYHFWPLRVILLDNHWCLIVVALKKKKTFGVTTTFFQFLQCQYMFIFIEIWLGIFAANIQTTSQYPLSCWKLRYLHVQWVL